MIRAAYTDVNTKTAEKNDLRFPDFSVLLKKDHLSLGNIRKPQVPFPFAVLLLFNVYMFVWNKTAGVGFRHFYMEVSPLTPGPSFPAQHAVFCSGFSL